MMRVLICGLLLTACSLFAAAPVYVALWFDTEDYIEPASDDAALRIARDLSAEGVRATFKVVGEKARVLEKRGRRDVIQALSRHAIGYHSNWTASIPLPRSTWFASGTSKALKSSKDGKDRAWPM